MYPEQLSGLPKPNLQPRETFRGLTFSLVHNWWHCNAWIAYSLSNQWQVILHICIISWVVIIKLIMWFHPNHWFRYWLHKLITHQIKPSWLGSHDLLDSIIWCNSTFDSICRGGGGYLFVLEWAHMFVKAELVLLFSSKNKPKQNPRAVLGNFQWEGRKTCTLQTFVRFYRRL